MKNIKFVSFSAIAGFILSLVFGLFSKSGFIKVFFTAILFALIFAILGFGLAFIYEKFLSVEGGDFDTSKSSTSEQKTTDSSIGNNVDIVIEDQELERGASAIHYNVGANRFMLNNSDVQKSQSTTSSNNGLDGATESKAQFVPVRNLETLQNFSGTENIKPSTLKDILVENPETSGNEDMDVLPEFGDFGTAATPYTNAAGSANDSLDVFSDSATSSTYTSRKKDADAEKFQNTELIAKAISSVLSDESL